MSSLSVSPVNLESRKANDVCWSVVYLAFFAANVAIAYYTASTATNNWEVIKTDCTNEGTRAGQLRAAFLGDTGLGHRLSEVSDNLVPDLLNSAPFLGGSFALALVLGVVWMAMLRSCAREIVYATLITKGLILIGLGLYLWQTLQSMCGLTTGDCYGAFAPLVLVALGVLYFMWLFCARDRIELTAKLLEQSVAVVSSHPGLFLASAFIFVLKFAFIAFSLFAFAALISSQVVVTPTGTSGQCDFMWTSTRADELMYATVSIFFYWSIQLWLCMRYYVVSLTTAIWYYQNQSLAAQEGSLADKEYTRAPVGASLRAAFTTGFGTIAFSSLILFVCEWLKSLARREGRNNGLVGCLIACCITCLLSYVEFLTRFALTFSALTGDAFCSSGRTFLDTCTRHGFMKVVVVDYIAAMTLQFGALVLGLLVTAVTVQMLQVSAFTHDDDRATVLAIIGAVAWLIASIVLVFISGLLLNIVDAAYCCIVLDLDNYHRTQVFHRPALAQAVLIKVQPAFVVVQPGGAASLAHAQPPIYAANGQPVGQPVAYAQP